MKKIYLKFKIIFIFEVLFSLLLCTGIIENKKQNTKKWDPENIKSSAKYYKNGIIDPEDYLNLDDRNKINNLIEGFKKEKNILVTFVIISEISNKYGLNLQKDIEKFTDELSAELSDNKRDIDSISLIVLFSIQDRQKIIRTGNKVQELIDNYTAGYILRSINQEMRYQQYGLAAEKILTKCFNRVMGKDKEISAIVGMIFFMSIVGCVALCYARSNSSHRFQRDPLIECKLDKIIEISKRNQKKKDFFEKVCVICLEDLSMDNEKNENYNKPLEFKDERPPATLEIKDDKLNDENFIQKESSPFISPDVNMSIAKLDCGHVFHPKCILEWMKKQNKCPVCRNIIEDDNKPLGRGLVEILSNINPRMSIYEISYLTDGLISWAPRRDYSTYNNNYVNDYNFSGIGVAGIFTAGWNAAGGAFDSW